MMSKKEKIISFFFFFSIIIISGVYSLEIGMCFTIQNLAFTHDRASTEGDEFTGLDFPWGVSVFASHAIDDKLTYETGFLQDAVLRNIYYNRLNYSISIMDFGFLTVGGGPFFGFFNSASAILKSGISTNVKLDFPGLIFLQFCADSTMGGRLVEEGDFLQEQSMIAGGFRVKNAICTIRMNTKQYTEKSDNDEEIIDSLIKYSFEADLFEKNIPFKILLKLSYQTLRKAFVNSLDDSSIKHTLNSILVGTRLEVDILNYLVMFLEMEPSIYTFGQDELLGISNPGPGGFLFQGLIGFKLDIDMLMPVETSF